MDRYSIRFFVLWSVVHIYFCQECPRQLHLVKPGRQCQKPCRNNYDCVGSDECICDNLCGFSCFDRSALCNPLNHILNGQIIGKGHRYGATRTFTCKTGYRLSQRVMLVCRSDRKWSDVQPRCVPMVCVNPPEIQNGYMYPMSKFHWTVGEKATYKCNHGYGFKNLHENTREVINVCDESGRWSGLTPRCVLHTQQNEIVRCDSPPDISNGWIENDRNVGDPNLDNNEPSVSADLFHDPPSVRIRWRPDDVIVYRCKKGYKLMGGSTRRICRSDGQWTGVQPRCENILRYSVCNAPIPPANGRISPERKLVWVAGDTLTVHCNNGFEVSAYNQIHCGTDGEWNNVIPNCIEISCDSPPDIPNGWIENDRNVGNPNLDNDKPSVSADLFHAPPSVRIRWRPDDVIIYRCKRGYKLIRGSTRRICRSDGQWTGVQPRCESIPRYNVCRAPIPPGNARFLPERKLIWVAGDALTVQCIDGFELSTYHQVRCGPDGEWNNDIPNCIEKYCKTPSKISNGWLEEEYAANTNTDNIHNLIHYVPPALAMKRMWRRDEVVTYKCQTGFRLFGGDEKRICRSDGTWTGIQPSCIGLFCRNLPKPVNGYIEPPYKQDWRVGDESFYFCNRGYKFEFPNEYKRQVTRLCQQNLEWSGPVPRCVMGGTNQPVYCRTLQSIRNGWIERDNNVEENQHNVFQSAINYPHRPVTVSVQWRPDDVIVYKCKSNYILTKGSKRRICKPDGQWTGIHPYCVESPTGTGIIYDDNIPRGKSDEKDGLGNSNELNMTADVDAVPSGRIFPVLNIIGGGCNSPTGIKNGWIESDSNVGSSQTESNQVAHDSIRVRWLVDDMIFYQCEFGYTLVGNRRRICRSDGQWTGEQPRCRSNEETCPPPIVTSYGRILPPGKTTWLSGDSFVVQCSHGFQVSNSNKVYCTNGKWSSDMPTCNSYPVNEQNCQSWTRLSDGKYYITTQNQSSYQEAIKNCHSLGGLLTVNGVKYSAIRKELLHSFTQKVEMDTYWIGLSDEKVERNWEWLDGSHLSLNEQLLLFEYHDIFWANGKDCAFITNNFYDKWKAGSCTRDRHYAICEREWCGEMMWKQSIHPKGFEGIILQGPLTMDEAVRKCMSLNGRVLHNYRIHKNKYFNLDLTNIGMQPRSGHDQDVEARFFSSLADWIINLWSPDETTTIGKTTTTTTVSPTLPPIGLDTYTENNEVILPFVFCERRVQSVVSPASLDVLSQLPLPRARSSDELSGDFLVDSVTSLLEQTPHSFEESSITKDDVCNPSPCLNGCRCQESLSGEFACENSGPNHFWGPKCQYESPVVHCGYDAITLTVSSDAVHHKIEEKAILYIAPHSTTNLAVISPRCLFARFDLALALYSVQIPLPFVDCGTSMEYHNDSVVFKNKIWRSRNETTVFETDTIIAEFNCVFDNFYHVSTALDVICCDIPLLISANGIFSFRSTLWKDPPPLDGLSIHSNGQERRKIHSMNGVVSYSVGEMIYITVDMNGGAYHNEIQPVLQKCWVSTNKSSETVVPGRDFVLYPRSSKAKGIFTTWGPKTIKQSAHFGFELLRAKESKRIYLHCNVKVILKKEIAKRSLGGETSSQFSHLTKGPIYYDFSKASKADDLSPTPYYQYILLVVGVFGLVITVQIVSCCITNTRLPYSVTADISPNTLST